MADMQLKAILSAVDKMSPVLKNVQNVAKATHKHLADLGTAASSIGGKLGLPIAALSGLTAGFSAMAIKNAVVSFAELGETIQKGALKTGQSVENFQRMKYVTEQAGVPIESMEGAMLKLNSRLGDLGKNKGLAGLLRQLKIDTKGANGELRTGMDILPQLADAFVRNDNPIKQARMGTALFGKTFGEMLPLLNVGAAGINKSLDRLSKLKSVMPKEVVDGAKEFADKLKDLDIVMKGFQMTIASELVPVLTPLIDELILWWSANKKLVGTKVKELVKDVVAAVKSFDWKGFAKDMGKIADAIGKVVDMFGGAQNALIGLVLFMNVGAISAVFSLIGALGRLVLFIGGPLLTGLGAAFSGTTLGAMAAKGLVGLASGGLAVAAAAAAGYGLGMLLAKGIDKGLSMIMGGDRSLGAEIYNQVESSTERVIAAWEKVKGWFTDYFEWVFGKWNQFFDLIKATADLISGVISSAAGLMVGQPAAGGAIGSAGQSPGRALINPQTAHVGGEIKITLGNAPAGTKVESIRSDSDVSLNPSVGYRSFAMGGPT